MFFSIFAHKFSYLSIFCHTRLQFAKTSSIHTFFCFYAAVFIKLKLRGCVISLWRTLFYVIYCIILDVS